MRHQKDYTAALNRIIKKLKASPENGKTISANLREKRRQLRKIRHDAASKRQEHLNSLLAAAHETKDKSKRKLILHLKRTEKNQCCFSLHRHYMKLTPLGASQNYGSLPPKTTKWITITDPHMMDQELLAYCQHHFSNSFGTPFTIPPLAPLLNYDGLTKFGQEVLKGTANIYKTKNRSKSWSQSRGVRI